MSNLIPAGVEIDGVAYRIIERLDLEEHVPFQWRPYKESVQLKLVQAAELSGSSRPAKSTRPDILNWRLDDWVLGEGFKFLDSSDDTNFQRYWYSQGAVDIRTKGQVSLGLAFSQSSTLGGVARKQGPFLTHRNASEEAWVDNTVYQQPVSTLDTWNNKGNMAPDAGNRIAGPARIAGQFAFVAYKDGSGAANSSRIRRVTTGYVASTFDNAINAENPLPADNRLYYLFDNSSTVQQMVLYKTPLNGTLPLANAQAYIINGVGQEAGIDAVANRIYIISQDSSHEEEPRVHFYDGSTGIERQIMPIGFRMNYPAATAADVTAYNASIFLGDVFFVFGYREGAGSGFPAVPMLCYVSGGRVGTVGTIREGITGVNDTIDTKGLTLAKGFNNQLLMGVDFGMVFSYDVLNGGISQLFDGITAGEDCISLDYYKGVYYAATRTQSAGTAATVKVYRTLTSGTNKYPASATLYSSYWDFNYPETNKMIKSVEIVTAPIPAGASVSISLLLDDQTTVTTDKDGGALTITSGTRKKFFVSGIKTSDGSKVQRNCRVLRVDTTLNAGTARATTPTVYTVMIEAMPFEYEYFYEAVVVLRDDAAGEWGLPNSTTGEAKYRNLLAIKDTSPAPPVKFRVRFNSGNRVLIPETKQTVFTCILQECDILMYNAGQGYARVLFRRMDN